MTIKTKLSTGIISVTESPIFILEVKDRIGIEACNVYNRDIETRTINFYTSINLTVSDSELLGSVTLSPNEDADVNFIVGQGFEIEKNIVAMVFLEEGEDPLTTAINCSTTYTQFTGDDI